MWKELAAPWPDSVPHSGWKVLLLWGTYLITEQLIGFGLLITGMLSQGVVSTADLAQSDKAALIFANPWAMTIRPLVLFVVLLIGLRLTRLRLFNPRQLSLWLPLQALVIFIGMEILFAGYLMLEPNFVTTQNQTALDVVLNGTPEWNVVLGVCILAPIVEEIVFRGLIMKYLLPQWPLIGWLVSSALFAGFHQPQSLFEFGIYALMGAVLGLTYWKTRRLEYAVAVHVINNLVASSTYFIR